MALGEPVPNWQARAHPPRKTLQGRFCRLEPISIEAHAADLFAANREDDGIWDYLPYGPFAGLTSYRAWLEQMCLSDDPQFYAVIPSRSGKAEGIASLMRIDCANGAIETGHINFSKRLQKTPAATEAIHVFMKLVFDELGYRRFEWKCNNLNEGSKNAAMRFGFVPEGVFRQHLVVKGRNRDTAWFSLIDKQWPQINAGFEAWLDQANFDPSGRQKSSLRKLVEMRRGQAASSTQMGM